MVLGRLLTVTTSQTAEELRQLATDVERVARESPAWSIAYTWIRTLTDHLQAVARVHETRDYEHSMSEQDRSDLRRARSAYDESRDRAIHMSIDHVANLLRIIGGLTDDAQAAIDPDAPPAGGSAQGAKQA
jgi:hypothetical protein